MKLPEGATSCRSLLVRHSPVTARHMQILARVMGETSTCPSAVVLQIEIRDCPILNIEGVPPVAEALLLQVPARSPDNRRMRPLGGPSTPSLSTARTRAAKMLRISTVKSGRIPIEFMDGPALALTPWVTFAGGDRAGKATQGVQVMSKCSVYVGLDVHMTWTTETK